MFDLYLPSKHGLSAGLFLSLCVPVFFIILKLLSRRREEHRLEATFSSQHQCQPPAVLQGKWPLSLDLLVKCIKADNAGQILRFFISILEDTGYTHAQYLFGLRSINTVDPENIEVLLSTQFKDFTLGAREQNFRPLLGHGIFTQNGAEWKQSRDLLRPVFNHQRTEYFTHIKHAVDNLLARVTEPTKEGFVDLQPLFFLLTLDVTTAAVLGASTNSLQDQGGKLGLAFANAFDTGQHYLAVRGRLGDLYWLFGGKKFRAACDFVHSFVDNIVREALEKKGILEPSGLEDEREDYLFIDALIARTRDPVIIRDQLVNVLLAGRDTTACLLSWTFRLLAQHPTVQHRLRAECLALPSYKAGTVPTKEELKNMRYLANVIHEVLRLYPSVPINMRQATKSTVLPVGGGPTRSSPILVRKGEAVCYSVYAMHRRKDLYGDDADHFRPDRWEPSSGRSPDLRNIGWGYLPFNGGPRVCLGQEFAFLEAAYTIVRLLQTFGDIRVGEEETVDQRDHPRHTVTLVVASANGCKVRLDGNGGSKQ
ncbi:cytochrome P450 [Usnea florida]